MKKRMSYGRPSLKTHKVDVFIPFIKRNSSLSSTDTQTIMSLLESCRLLWAKNSYHDLIKDGKIVAAAQEIMCPFLDAVTPIGMAMHMYPASDKNGRVNKDKLSPTMTEIGYPEFDYDINRITLHDSDTLSVIIFRPNNQIAFTSIHSHKVTEATTFTPGIYEASLDPDAFNTPITVIAPSNTPTITEELSTHLVGWFLPNDDLKINPHFSIQRHMAFCLDQLKRNPQISSKGTYTHTNSIV